MIVSLSLDVERNCMKYIVVKGSIINVCKFGFVLNVCIQRCIGEAEI